MEKALHLHIGTPKTGTTSIQKTLFNTQTLLNKHDFALFCEKPNGTISTNGTIANYWEEPVKFYNTHTHNKIYAEGFGIYYWGCIPIKSPLEFVNKLVELPQKNIICSSEYFYSFNNSHKNSISYELVRNLKKHFKKINIYCYIRRQDLYAMSFHQQYSKMIRKNVCGLKALPILQDNIMSFYNFYGMISIFGDLFGDENIHLRDFDRKKLIDGDVVKDFYSCLGLQDLLSQVDIARLNESLGAERTKVGHLINLSSIKEHTDLQKKIRQYLDNTGKLLPSRKEAEEFYSHFIESNIQLNKRFKISSEYEDIFDHDFSMYPEEATDLWTEDTANKAIINILNTIPDLVAQSNLLKQNDILKSFSIIKYLKFKYTYYRIMSELTFGKRKKNYKKKKNDLKIILQQYKKRI